MMNTATPTAMRERRQYEHREQEDPDESTEDGMGPMFGKEQRAGYEEKSEQDKPRRGGEYAAVSATIRHADLVLSEDTHIRLVSEQGVSVQIDLREPIARLAFGVFNLD